MLFLTVRKCICCIIHPILVNKTDATTYATLLAGSENMLQWYLFLLTGWKHSQKALLHCCF